MKKIIFLVLFLNSFVFGSTCVPTGYVAVFISSTSSTSGSNCNLPSYYPHTWCSSNTSYNIMTVSTYVNDGTSTDCGTGYYNSDTNYQNYQLIYGDICPVGLDKDINGVCVDIPTCEIGTIWNPLTDTCEYDPNTADGDGDSILDKCDPDYVDYLTMDCDSNSIPNATDADIDGDGILNGNDPTPNGSTSGSTTTDVPCPSTSMTMTPVKEQGSCSMSNPLFYPIPDGELRYVKNVYWDDCRKSCMATIGSCPYGQVIKDGICKSAIPNIDDCLGTSDCDIVSFGVDNSQSCLKRCYCSTILDPNPQTAYFTQEVSCAENIENQEQLEDLKLSDDTNKTLPVDLLKDSNASADLDVSASMKVALDSYAGSKEATQLDLLSESKIQSLQLVSANTNLKNIQSTLENFSATSTSNQGTINGSLQDIDAGIDTSNALLTDIKDNSEAIKNNLEGKNSDGTAVDTSIIDSNFAGVDSFFTDVQNGFTNIGNSYIDLTANIEQGFLYSAPTGSSVATTVNVFGKNITFDISSVLIQLAPIIYYFMYISMFLLAIKIIFLGFMVV